MGSLGLPVYVKSPYRNSNHYRYGHFCAVMVTSVRLPVHSTVSLSKILNRQLKNAAVLALEKGPISGYVDVLALNKVRLFCIDLDKPVSIYADRLPGNVFFSVDLSLGSFADHIRAQGVLSLIHI